MVGHRHRIFEVYWESSSFLACNSRLCSAVRRPHPPQRPVLGHIHCFRQCEIMGSQDPAVRCSAMWCGGVLEVSSSPLEVELTGSSWHLRYRPYAQCAQTGSDDVTGLLQWVWVVPLSSGPRHFEQNGCIWYLAAFADTTDWKHRSVVSENETGKVLEGQRMVTVSHPTLPPTKSQGSSSLQSCMGTGMIGIPLWESYREGNGFCGTHICTSTNNNN